MSFFPLIALGIGAEVCRLSGDAAYSAECVLCSATVSSGSRERIRYIANGRCDFVPTDGVVDATYGWPVREGQALKVPSGVFFNGSVVIRGSHATVTGGGLFSSRVQLTDPSFIDVTVTNVIAQDNVAVVVQGPPGLARGFDGTRISACRTFSGTGVDVAVVNAGKLSVLESSVIYENVAALTTSPNYDAFSIESELKALSSAYITDITDGELPAWVGTLQRASGWLTATVIAMAVTRYSLAKLSV